MRHVKIDTTSINDKKSFLEAFGNAFGFFEGYGRNWDAWIDCMSCLDGEFTEFKLEDDELLVIEIEGTDALEERLPEMVVDLVGCTAFVNQRFINRNVESRIALLFV